MVEGVNSNKYKKKTTRFRNNRISVFGFSFTVIPPASSPGIGR
jgi:hypothetical protein